jgi:hypothetical protein
VPGIQQAAQDLTVTARLGAEDGVRLVHQQGPDWIGEDAVGVVGEDCTQILLEAADGCGARCLTGEIRQDRLGGLLVTGLQMAEGFFGRCGLLLVAALLMPLGGRPRHVERGEDQGDGESARIVRGIGEFLGGFP